MGINHSILFIGKKDDVYCARALEYLEQHCSGLTVFIGKRPDPYPREMLNWQGDYIMSYLSPWIIPSNLLMRIRRAGLNFHPGPPEYPGIGCTNFAIYDQADTFGVTCHLMEPKVDTGPLVQVRRFPLYDTDSVYSLTQRCYATILTLFYDIIDIIRKDEPLPILNETWTRRPYRRQELNALCRLTPDMDEQEINRRVKAVTFPNAPGAYMDVEGQKIPYPRSQ